MANQNKRIVDLPLILSGDVSSLDVLPIVNVETDVTNKITIDQLSAFFTSNSNYYLTGGTYNTLTENVDFTGNNPVTNFSVNLTPLIFTGNTFITGGTFDTNTDTLTIYSNNISPIVITGFTDYYTTGGTYNNGTKLITFNRNDGTTGYTVDLSTIDTNDTFSTGGTVTQSSSISSPNQTIEITGNDGFIPYNITGVTDTFTTGGTYDNNTALITFNRNDGQIGYVVDLSGLDLNDTYVTGGTSSGSTNSTPNATIELTYNQDVPPGVYSLEYKDTFITGFTYNDANEFRLTNNDGTNLLTQINIVTGLTVNGNIEMGNGATRQIYSTGLSNISSIEYAPNGTSVQVRWDGGGDSTALSINNTDFVLLSSSRSAFGGITYGADYSPYYTDRSLIDLGYFNSNNRYVTGGTYDNNTALISYSGANGFPSFNVDLSSLDLNDTYVTGGTLTQPTYNTNNGLINLLYSQDVLPSTYSIPYTDTFTTGFTYNNNTFKIFDNSGNTFNATINSVTGLTVNGNLNVNGNISHTGNTTQSGNVDITGATFMSGNFCMNNMNTTGQTGTNCLDTTLIPTGTTVTHQFQGAPGVLAHVGDLSSGEPNSRGFTYFENNVSITTFSVVGTGAYTPVVGAPTTFPPYNNLFTVTTGATAATTNKMTYNYPPATGSSSATYLKFTVSVSLQNAQNQQLTFQVRRTRNSISGFIPTGMSITPQSNNIQCITLNGIADALHNDEFEVVVKNDTGSGVPNNIRITDLAFSMFT